MRKVSSLALLVLLTALPPAFAGRIEFYDETGGNGNRLRTLPDFPPANINLKTEYESDHDRIQSLRLRWVAPDTRIQLYDDPDAQDSNDYAVITVSEWRDEIIVNNLEHDLNNSAIAIDYHHKNGLQGKVSHIKIDSQLLAEDAPTEAMLERCIQRIYPFQQKRGEAYEFMHSDYRYRVWFPDYAVGPGVTVSTKIDHIRWWTEDDHAQLTLASDETGQLTDASVEIKLGDDEVFRVALEDIAGKPSNEINNRKENVVAMAATRLGKAMRAASRKLNDGGGRQNFPAVVQQVMNEIGGTLVQQGCLFPAPAPDLEPEG